MAIKLSRDLKQQTTTPEGTGTSKGFDISGTSGVNYDIEKIEKSKNRQDPGAELLAELSGNGKTVGSMSIKKEEKHIFANNIDMKNYLFKNEPSTDAYTPAITLRRPIVMWEEGTPDKNTEEDNESLYDTVFSLQDQLKNLKEEMLKLKSSQISEIELYNNGSLKSDKNSIPTSGAVYDFVKQYVYVDGISNEIISINGNREFREILSNGKIVENDKSFSLNYEEDYYKIINNKNGTFSLTLGGKNE